MSGPELRGGARLIDVARRLLEQGGPRAVTVHGVAARAGVSAPSLYKHFAGREELIRTLQAEGWEEFQRALAPSLKAKNPLARLRNCGQRYVEFGLDRPHLYRLLFLSDEAALAATDNEGQASPGLAFLVALVQDCQKSGTLPRTGDSEDLAMAFWATCHGLVALYLQGGGKPRFERTRYLAMSRRALTALTRRT